MPNDLHVRERHPPRPGSETAGDLGKRATAYFLGVKWSQVQILSARHCQPDTVSPTEKQQIRGGFGEIRRRLVRTRQGYVQQPVQQPADLLSNTLVS